MITNIAAAFYTLFGIVTIVGGVQGYLNAKSLPSLIAGGILGILLIIGGWQLLVHRVLGTVLVLIASAAIGGRFIPAFIKKGDWWPAGTEAILAVLGLAFTLILYVKK